MNTWFFEVFDDALLVWGVNVLVQWTLVTAVALAVGAFFRRRPAVRYGVLFSGLLLVLLVPLSAAGMQGAGGGLLSVVRIDDSPIAAIPAASARPEQERVPSSVTDGHETRRGETQGEAPTLTASANRPTQRDSAASANELAPSATTIDRLARAVLSAVMGIWLTGALLLLVRMAVGWQRMAAILRSSRPTTDEALAAAFAGVSTIRDATLAISDRVSGPIAAGLRRPCVVLPASLVGRLSPEQTHAILVHELAHLSRRDQVVVLLQNVARALGWLHPLIVLLNRRLAQAREEVCDNHVLADIDAPSYGRTLLTLAQWIQTAQPQPGAVGFFASQWTLETRVAELLDEGRSRATCMTARGKIAIAALAVVLAGIATLGTVGRTAGQPVVAQAATNAGANAGAILVKGRIATAQGEPVGGAFVAVVGTDTTKAFYERRTLAEGVAAAAGRYELTLSGVSPKTHREVSVIARADKLALAWKHIDLNAAESRIDLKLPPERLIQLRLVDLQGKPAANVAVEVSSIVPTEGKGKDRTGVDFWQMDPQPKKALPRPITDAGGLLTIPGIPADSGVLLEVVPSERFARQSLLLNSGEPEKRPADDGTYRPIVKNIPPGQIATITLAPATIFEGVVLLGDTGQPAANSRITIWASQKGIPSMVSVDGKTDARGRFRLNPYAGDRFGILAYPPADVPYFPRRVDDIARTVEQLLKPLLGSKREIEIRLPAAVLASGTVIDAESGAPLVGASVQYRAQNNKYATDDIVTGWQNMKHTDDQGRYKITVPPGPGTLLVHAPAGASYVLQEKSGGEIDAGKPGGRRCYAHAFQAIAPPVPNAKAAAANNVTLDPIKLHPGRAVVVKLVDGDGKAIEQAVPVTRLMVSPASSRFGCYGRLEPGSSIEIRGLEKGKQYRVHFLDPNRRLGATAMISAKDPQPTITLQPCASARVRFLQPDGKPVPAGLRFQFTMVVTPGPPTHDPTNLSAMLAEEEAVANIDRVNYGHDYGTDKNGVLSLPALIPGATYRFVDMNEEKDVVAKEFVAEAGKLHDLGDIKLLRKH